MQQQIDNNIVPTEKEMRSKMINANSVTRFNTNFILTVIMVHGPAVIIKIQQRAASQIIELIRLKCAHFLQILQTRLTKFGKELHKKF